MKLALAPLTALLLAIPSLASAQPAPEAEGEPPGSPAPVSTAAPALAPAPSPALVPALPGRAEAPLPAAPAPPRYDYLRFGAGFRVGYIDDPGFDTFATDDVLAQVSLDATYAFYTRGKLAISGGAAWDVGSRTSGARGLSTKLTVHRLTVPIEARWYVTPWFDLFAKVAPGAVALYARVEDPSSPATLEHAPWVFATDLSVGASFRLAGTSNHGRRHPRLWITHEIGYGLTTGHDLRPQPSRNEEDVLGSDDRTNLGSLAVNGVFLRTGLALSF